MANKRLTISIQDENTAIKALKRGFVDAWQSDEYSGEYLMFESSTALFKTISPKRWELMRQLQGMGKTSQRELSRQLGRDVHRIRDDVKILIGLGIIEQDDEGIHIPYYSIRTDFTLTCEAA